MDALPKKDRETLINLETGMRPKSCVECIFYYNVFDECGFCGGGCTMSDGLEIYDNLQKHKDCPLTKNDVKRVDIPPVR